MITQAQALECFNYNFQNGKLIRRKDVRRGFEAGTVAGYKSRKGCLVVSVKGVSGIKAHRLIWLMVTGELPTLIDHINGDPSDNRWCNLRDVSQQENMRNVRMQKNNTSGVMGVWRCKRYGKWNAEIKVNYKKICLGSFNSVEAAAEARKAAEIKYGFHDNHGRKV